MSGAAFIDAMNPRIALVGYARAGKDEVGKALVDVFGYTRHTYGDIIKRQLDPLIHEHLGFSAFTEVDSEKTQIRGLLEQWGTANADSIMNEMQRTMPEKAVNTRMCRAEEAQWWKDNGGEVWLVERPGFGPATEWEEEEVNRLRHKVGIDRYFHNNRGINQITHKIAEIKVLNKVVV